MSRSKSRRATSRSKSSRCQKGQVYTDPELRDMIKRVILKGNKGGRPGQWSARKAQLVAQEYKSLGGEYCRPKSRSPAQASLERWTRERWTTATGRPALDPRTGTMDRYLPAQAWESLSRGEIEATRSKKKASKSQFVPNTSAARRARSRV